MAFDADLLTARVESRPGPGAGERVGFSSEEPIKADEIRVAPGYFDARWRAANNRVRKAILHFDDRTVEGDFRDARYDDTPVAEIELYKEIY
jgi:hypothetical protein